MINAMVENYIFKRRKKEKKKVFCFEEKYVRLVSVLSQVDNFIYEKNISLIFPEAIKQYPFAWKINHQTNLFQDNNSERNSLQYRKTTPHPFFQHSPLYSLTIFGKYFLLIINNVDNMHNANSFLFVCSDNLCYIITHLLSMEYIQSM